MTLLAGLPAFLAYVATAIALIALYLTVYVSATAHREITLIREGNAAAAIALGGSLMGYATPLSVAIHESASIPELLIWGAVALLLQIGAYGLVRLLLPDLSRRIATGEHASGILLAAASLAIGLVDAAAMTS